MPVPVKTIPLSAPVMVGEPVRKKSPETARAEEGEVVPIPTEPPFVTTKFVAVELPIANAGPVMPFGFIERRPHGVVVPMPILPLAAIRILSAKELEVFIVEKVTYEGV